MNAEEIIQEKPHLRETILLYEKVLTFDSMVAKMTDVITLDEVTYPPEIADAVVERFSANFGIPEEHLIPFREALKMGQLDFTRLPLNELPSFSFPYHEDELGLILFLMSKPFFLRLGEMYHLDGNTWEEGRCPVCHARPSLASIDSENRRKLYCSYCGTKGSYKRLGCPLCANDDTSKITLFTFDQEKDFRIDACHQCKSYVKTVLNESIIENRLTPDLADLVSLPLDVIAQGKGFQRHSPNPIGMTKMG
jgi:FdhE protein